MWPADARRTDLDKERMDRNSFELDVRCQGFMSDSDEEIDGKEKGGSRNGIPFESWAR